jgi:lysophospholipase L1-like esterase
MALIISNTLYKMVLVNSGAMNYGRMKKRYRKIAMINFGLIKNKLGADGKFNIVFTGDSITSTEWVHPNWREMVEYVLKEETQKQFEDWRVPSWGIRCFNCGFDGATTGDILSKSEEIKSLRPNLVVGLMGGNDPVLGVSASKAKENLESLFDQLGTQTEIVWCNSTPAGEGNKKNIEYEPYARIIDELMARPNLKTIDMFEIYKKFPTEKFFTFISEENPVEGIRAGEVDQQHPNQLGNAYIAKVILGEVFGIDFDPEKYIETTLMGNKYPEY